MSDVVIRAEGLGKRYRIRHQRRERYTSLRDVIADKARGLFAGRQDDRPAPVEDFWALRDVSFEVKRGEVLGIIGRNGAGKSTLLKILSRITEPTAGRVTLDGRVASLLEVGTGFHPELTGRENISLNGAILGMSGAEIARKFDEIVDFAGVERFLDTPVKHYSSGMYVRLAFAVAAHLEPEILILDEVLAVGDIEFQKKCFDAMESTIGSGRTVLIVSHNTARLNTFCRRGILLGDGEIQFDGSMTDAIGAYSAALQSDQSCGDPSFVDLRNRTDRSGSGHAKFESVWLSQRGTRTANFEFSQSFQIGFRACVAEAIGPALVTVTIRSGQGIMIHDSWNVNHACEWIAKLGRYEFSIEFKSPPLYPGRYHVDLWIGDRLTHRVDFISEAASFTVRPAVASRLQQPLEGGLAYIDADWSVTSTSGSNEMRAFGS